MKQLEFAQPAMSKAELKQFVRDRLKGFEERQRIRDLIRQCGCRRKAAQAESREQLPLFTTTAGGTG